MSQAPSLTATSYIVLGLVERLGEASAYDLKQAVADSVGNFWSVPHSQVYREATRLEDAGYLESRTERTPGGRARKAYRLLPSGMQALERWRAEPTEALPDLRDPGLLKLHLGADPQRLSRARLAAHRRKLAEYEARRRLDPGAGPRGPWMTLDAGIAHEREWIRFWSEIAGGDRTGRSSRPGDVG
jgi:PadR family transcriptional regulator, regulatory protein AphA